MSEYVCSKCLKKYAAEDKNLQNIRCPYCGNKIFFKATPPVVKSVSTD